MRYCDRMVGYATAFRLFREPWSLYRWVLKRPYRLENVYQNDMKQVRTLISPSRNSIVEILWIDAQHELCMCNILTCKILD